MKLLFAKFPLIAALQIYQVSNVYNLAWGQNTNLNMSKSIVRSNVDKSHFVRNAERADISREQQDSY